MGEGEVNTWQFGGVTLYQGNCMDVLPTLPAESVQACITSPPYWGLRDYGTARWEGGEAGCDHRRDKSGGIASSTLDGGKATINHQQEADYTHVCRKCGAIRIDQQLGLERVPDCLGWATKQPCGECYVCHTVAWAREVRRVLRGDGVMFLVLGDSYASSGVSGMQSSTANLARHGDNGYNPKMQGQIFGRAPTPSGLKPKDLCGIPWRVALALQADGWWLRSDVIWAKPNPMPESVTDRPTKAHEYVFLLAKSARYYWDAEAVKEPMAEESAARYEYAFGGPKNEHLKVTDKPTAVVGNRIPTNGRNLRTVWNIATQPYAGAHFAVFPEKLIEPMVKAATSERGCCPKCGKAWERMVEREYKGSAGLDYKDNGAGRGQRSHSGGDAWHKWKAEHPDRVIGWQPACTCGNRVICPTCGGHYQDDAGNICETCGGDCEIIELYNPIPCTILDPFGGSGTVASVALRLGRRAILCELNPDYIELQKERIERTQPALARFDIS